MADYTKLLLINDVYHEYKTLSKRLTNFVSPEVPRLTGPPRKRKVVDEIVLHESVTRSTEITIGVLKRRNLGVHFIIGPDGKITQHGDLVLDQLAHAGRIHNSRSIGVEIVNPYYPKYNFCGPWSTIIQARWAHQKQYVVPMPEQAESTYLLVKALLATKEERFNVPTNWIGFDPTKKRLAMARITRARLPVAGVIAHTAFGHADGAWPMLYCILREEGDPRWAYENAIILATTNRWFVDLRGVL